MSADQAVMNCSQCGREIRFPKSRNGYVFNCPNCGELLRAVDREQKEFVDASLVRPLPETKKKSFTEQLAENQAAHKQAVRPAKSGELGYEKQVKACMEGQEIFVRKEIQYLPTQLFEGEKIELLAKGMLGNKTGVVALTNLRVVFVECGIAFRKQVEDIQLSKVSSVKGKKGMMFGELEVFTSGNDVKIKQVAPGKMAVEIANAIRAKLSNPTPVEKQAPTESSRSAADRIAELKTLLDADLIDRAEFDSKKSEILSSL